MFVIERENVCVKFYSSSAKIVESIKMSVTQYTRKIAEILDEQILGLNMIDTISRIDYLASAYASEHEIRLAKAVEQSVKTEVLDVYRKIVPAFG